MVPNLSPEQYEYRDGAQLLQHGPTWPLLNKQWVNHGQTEREGTLALPTFSDSLQRFPSLSTHFAKGLKDAPEHVLSDIEVQGAHVEAHWSTTALLQVVGHGCQSVFLSLWKKEMMGHAPHLPPLSPSSYVHFSGCSPVRPVQ